MDIQEIGSKFEDLLLANPDFDESLLEKDEDGCYEDSDINSMYQMFEAGIEAAEFKEIRATKAQAAPEGFVLVPREPTKDTLIEIASVCIGSDFANLNESAELYKAMIKAQEPTND